MDGKNLYWTVLGFLQGKSAEYDVVSSIPVLPIHVENYHPTESTLDSVSCCDNVMLDCPPQPIQIWPKMLISNQ